MLTFPRYRHSLFACFLTEPSDSPDFSGRFARGVDLVAQIECG
jgi:hypothetical protein